MKLRVVTPAVVAAALLFVAAGCGSDSTATTTQVDDVTTSVAAPAADPGTAADASAPAGIVQVDPVTAANLIVNGPSELVVLDIRTPDEFVAGHIVGATDIDFYEPDFADRIADLASLLGDISGTLAAGAVAALLGHQLWKAARKS